MKAGGLNGRPDDAHGGAGSFDFETWELLELPSGHWLGICARWDLMLQAATRAELQALVRQTITSMHG